MNSPDETEMIENQITQIGQDNGSNAGQKNKTNHSLGKSKRSRGRKRNNEGELSHGVDIHQINMDNIATDVITNRESEHVEVIDVEKVKDLPLVDLTKDSQNEVYVDLTKELPISPEPTIKGITGSSFDSSIICISPTGTAQCSQSLQHNNKKTDDIVMVAQPLESVTKDSTSENTLVSCTICLDNYDQIKKLRKQLTSTTCGHVFCNKCIDAALRIQAKCPTCRKKITRKQLHPLFL